MRGAPMLSFPTGDPQEEWLLLFSHVPPTCVAGVETEAQGQRGKHIHH